MNKLVENYYLHEPIGKGVYGEVYRSVHQKSKLQFAVKIIPKATFKANPKLEQLAINEINVLSSLKSDNIVRFVETLKTPNNFYFVYEFCNGGTLQNILQKRKTLPEGEALLVLRQIIDAFKELNKNNIMHRDLKPDNIFFSNGKVKLGDFGFCKMLEVNMTQTMLGSPIYMAPEILKQEIYTFKADIWSLGVVLFEMLFGYCPFESNSIYQLINVINETKLEMPKQQHPITKETELLIEKMLTKDQFKRIEWVDLFEIQINDEGKIISGCKSNLGFEALEKYFLFDLKNEDEDRERDRRREKEKEKEKGKENLASLHDELKSEPSPISSISDNNFTFEVKSQENKNSYSGKYETFSYKYDVKNDSISEKNGIIAETFSNKKISNPSSASNYREKEPSPNKSFSKKSTSENSLDDAFNRRHSKWQKAIQVMQELTENGEAQNEYLMYCVMVVLLRQVTEEYKSHPEWTDVLLEEKKCLTEAIRSLSRDDKVDPAQAKAELTRLWRNVKERDRSCWTKAVQFIYNDSTTEVEGLLILSFI